MSEKTLIVSISLLLQCLICAAQYESMVVVKSGISIREEPTLNSNKVASVKFGEMVEVLNQNEQKDTVDGMNGNWVRIAYDQYVGYVFDAYLGRFAKHDKNFPENYPQFFKLDAICGEERFFNNDFFWYGVFERGDEFKVLPVHIEFSVHSKNWKDELYDQYLKVSIDRIERPLFLIGFPDSIPSYTFPKVDFMRNQQRHVYPGQHFTITHYSAKGVGLYYLASYGEVKDTQPANNFLPPFMTAKNYKIKLIHAGNGVVHSKDILEDIQGPIINESMPSIQFIGDLNYDGVPDILLFVMPRHSSASTYLFMSGYSKDEIITKVAHNTWESCH
ncbi:MAG TPA: SH3 domain-containing protein [Chryseosolibacter sp.]|nr:SH3 domain-containing protein [Chryseosolibacter sp.]